MREARVLFGLVIVAGTFAFTASSALAIWTNPGGKGSYRSGEVTFTVGSAAFSCEKTEGIYHVSSTGGQVKLTEAMWSKCTPAVVSCKGLVMTQQKKEGTKEGIATGSFSETCTITGILGCLITISPQENPGPLKSIKLIKSSSNQEDEVAISGITATATGTSCLLNSKTSVEMKIPKLLLEGVGLE